MSGVSFKGQVERPSLWLRQTNLATSFSGIHKALKNKASTNRIIIGADEAGYGPNLGPLLIVATAWEIPEEMGTDAFSAAIQPVFRMKPWLLGCDHIPLGDSKQLFQPSSGLASIEAGLLTMLLQIDAPRTLICPTNLQDFRQFVIWQKQPQTNQSKRDTIAPWYEQLEKWPVPSVVPPTEILRLAELARTALQSNSIQLLAVRAAIVSESEFNESVSLSGSKGQLLSATTLELVSSFCIDEPRSVEVFCDRQGGRKNYLPILLDALPNEWFAELLQSKTCVSYRNTRSPRRDFHFTVGGDSFGPTALASMLAKYLRERLMQSFNAFWQLQLPNLRPTAGYPLDAKRFREAIESTALALQLPERVWWRCR